MLRRLDAMTPQEEQLLEEFAAYVRKPFDKRCVAAYVERPIPAAITEEALEHLQRAIDEADKT
jgi:hypothetical protein